MAFLWDKERYSNILPADQDTLAFSLASKEQYNRNMFSVLEPSVQLDTNNSLMQKCLETFTLLSVLEAS